MAISLKELSEKIVKPGFWSPDFKSAIGINSGFIVKTVGYISSFAETATIEYNELKINGQLMSSAANNAENKYMTNSNIIIPVTIGDEVTYRGMHNESNTFFIPAILTIYYIVRYNIYKLVRFLSHLNAKFGGERR